MNQPTRSILFLALLAGLTSAATAESLRYQGQLTDGGQPATGHYDLQISLHDAAEGGRMVGEVVTLSRVPVLDGAFAVDIEAPDAARNTTAWLQASVRDATGGGAFVPLAKREQVTLAPKIDACWSTTGDTGSNPTVNFLGNLDNQTLVLTSPSGVSVNQRAQIAGVSADLRVFPKTGGDADADLELASRSGKTASVYVRDGSGSLVLTSGSAGLEVFDGVSAAVQDAGGPVMTVSGRMRLTASGSTATAAAGGIWLDDEAVQKAFVGRGNNNQEWTGVFSDNAWRMAVHDDGLVTINSTAQVLSGVDLQVNARPVAGDADADLGLVSRSDRRARMFVSDADGGLRLNVLTVLPGTNYLTMGNGATLSNGGTWTNASSRTLKEGFAAVDPLALLGKVLSLPITTWSYKGSEEGLHIGPVAEDFKATFGLAGDGRAISTVDADGVALAAIQGLNAKLEAENAALRERLERVEAALSRLAPAR